MWRWIVQMDVRFTSDCSLLTGRRTNVSLLIPSQDILCKVGNKTMAVEVASVDGRGRACRRKERSRTCPGALLWDFWWRKPRVEQHLDSLNLCFLQTSGQNDAMRFKLSAKLEAQLPRAGTVFQRPMPLIRVTYDCGSRVATLSMVLSRDGQGERSRR